MATEANASDPSVDIEWQKKQQGIRRNNDVKEIFLSDRNAETVCSFAPYSNLQRLWLSNNRLRTLPNLDKNCCLTELHLHYNLLRDVSGIGHLTLLEVLMLHGNQLTDLEKVTHELRRMQNLVVLNMFDNPLSQEKDYRNYVIYHVPSLKLLDRTGVQKTERDRARALYDQENEAVRDTVAFLRRSEGPPMLYYRRPTAFSLTRPVKDSQTMVERSPLTKFSAVELDAAFYKRIKSKALWTYSHLDWSKAPRPSGRTTAYQSTSNVQKEEQPDFMTITFR